MRTAWLAFFGSPRGRKGWFAGTAALTGGMACLICGNRDCGLCPQPPLPSLGDQLECETGDLVETHSGYSSLQFACSRAVIGQCLGAFSNIGLHRN